MLKNAKKYIKNGSLNKVNILKKNSAYNIPVLVIDIISDCMLKIKIACNTKEYKEGDLLKVNYKLLNDVNEKAWNNIVGEFKSK